MVWLPRHFSPSESSYYSSMPKMLCIFLMEVQSCPDKIGRDGLPKLSTSVVA